MSKSTLEINVLDASSQMELNEYRELGTVEEFRQLKQESHSGVRRIESTAAILKYMFYALCIVLVLKTILL